MSAQDNEVTVPELKAYISEVLDTDEISGFESFEAFYDWFDTATTYDQRAEEVDLADHKKLIEQAYNELLAEGA